MGRTGHQVDVLPEPRRVRVLLDGEVLAETERALELRETGLPARWYIPQEDLNSERLKATGFTSHCPFKGDARYMSARVGERLEEGIAWSYPDPLPEVAAIAGHWAFYPDRADIEVDE
jgi:uncharacterized protein (DUF427 family)